MKRLSNLFKDVFNINSDPKVDMINMCSECAPDPCGALTGAKRKILQAADGISKQCITCDGPNCEKLNPLNKCAGCRCTYYCSKECQLEHWAANHKVYCALIKRSTTEYVERKSKAIMIEKMSYNKGGLTICCYECGASPPVKPVHFEKCLHAFCLECIYDWQEEVDELGIVDGWEVYCACGNQQSFVDVKAQAKTKGDTYIWYAETYPLCFSEKKKFFDYALEEHEKILMFVHKDLDACYSKATVLKLSGDLDEALKLYDDIDLWIRPYGDTGTRCITLQDIAVNRADILKQKGRWREALSIFNHQKQVILEVLESSDYPIERYKQYLDSMIRFGIFECKINLGKANDVIKEIDRIYLDSFRHLPTLHKWKALALKEIGSLDEAIDTINRGVLYEAPYCTVTKINNFRLYEELCALKKNNQVENGTTVCQCSDTIPITDYPCDTNPVDFVEEKIYDSEFLRLVLPYYNIHGKVRSPFVERFVNSIRSINVSDMVDDMESEDESSNPE